MERSAEMEQITRDWIERLAEMNPDPRELANAYRFFCLTAVSDMGQGRANAKQYVSDFVCSRRA